MSLQLHTYRPELGVGIAQKGENWILADIDQGQGKVQMISPGDGRHLTERLGLTPFQKTFSNEQQLLEFLMREYVAIHRETMAADSASDLDDDLEYLGRDLLLDWLREMQHRLDVEDLRGIDVRTVLRHLDIMLRHRPYESDAELLGLLVPLRNAWADRFELPTDSACGESLEELQELERRFPSLNGTTIKRRAELQQFAAVR